MELPNFLTLEQIHYLIIYCRIEQNTAREKAKPNQQETLINSLVEADSKGHKEKTKH